MQRKDEFTAEIFSQKDTAKVESLIKAKADVNQHFSDGDSPLTLAIKHGHEDATDLLLEAKAEVKSIELTEYGNISKKTIDSLLEFGYINHIYNSGKTMLHVAAEEGNYDVVKNLIECHANACYRGPCKRSALFFAVGDDSNIINRLLCIQYLIEQHVMHQLTISVDAALSNALSLVSKKNTPQALSIIKILIENKADVNNENIFGYIGYSGPLYTAIELKNIELIQILLEAKANVSMKNCGHKTALHQAASSGNLEIVKTLIEHKSDVNAIESRNRTPIMMAVSGKKENIDYALFEKRRRSQIAGFNLNDEDDQTPIIRYLIDQKANVNLKDSYGQTALDFATESSNIDNVKVLLEAKASTTDLHVSIWNKIWDLSYTKHLGMNIWKLSTSNNPEFSQPFTCYGNSASCQINEHEYKKYHSDGELEKSEIREALSQLVPKELGGIIIEYHCYNANAKSPSLFSHSSSPSLKEVQNNESDDEEFINPLKESQDSESKKTTSNQFIILPSQNNSSLFSHSSSLSLKQILAESDDEVFINLIKEPQNNESKKTTSNQFITLSSQNNSSLFSHSSSPSLKQISNDESDDEELNNYTSSRFLIKPYRKSKQ